MSTQDESNKQHTQIINEHVSVRVAGTGDVAVNQPGDQVAGDKVLGDKVLGDKYEHRHYYPAQPRPMIDLDQAQQILATMPLDDLPALAPLPPGSRIQLRRNPLFVGRETDLKAIAQQLKGGGAAAITTGIGGVGKTLLAVEFAHRYGRYFAGGVFWLSFANPAGIDYEIAACGGTGAMELYSDASGLSQTEQVEKVQAEWTLSIPRLLVFDNCDDLPGMTAETLLSARLPKSGGCRVLVTSRRGQWRKDLGIAPLPLGLFSRAESITLLRSHRDNINDADVDAIAAELGDLPLALSLAGSYLEIYHDDALGVPRVYLTNLRKQLLNHRSLNTQERSVRATFDLSYQRLDAANPLDTLAIAALARASHLAPGEPFPRNLLLDTLNPRIQKRMSGLVARFGRWLHRHINASGTADGEANIEQSADALRRLIVLGLLEIADERALRIHRLIAVFAKAVIGDAEAQAAVEQVLADTGNHLVQAGFPAQVLPVIAHLRHAMVVANPRGDALAGDLANALGRAEEALINYVAARPLYERALAIWEQVLGPQHPDTLSTLNNLALLIKSQGEYAAARPLYERALQVTERVLGSQHSDTATSLNNLAVLLESQGEYAAARPLYERALTIREQVLGPQHPSTATSLNNLAGLLESQGEYAAAQPLFERALEIREQALGPNHPSTAQSLNNLALLFYHQSNYRVARPLYERALTIREQTLGSQHPSTAQSLNNLALLLFRQGEYEAALPLFERALEIREQALGPNHPSTAQSLNNLAVLLESQGEYTAARQLYERALAIRERTLGSQHPDISQSLNNLAYLLQSQGQYAAARPLYERALQIMEQTLGSQHPDTRIVSANLNDLIATMQALP